MGYTSKIPISRGTNDYYPLNFGVRHFQTNQGFEVLQTHKSLAGTSQHARLTPPEIQVTIRFHTGFQALVDVRSDKLAWIRIVHNAVLQPELRWMPKAFKQAKGNWQPILEEEISRHKPEKVSLTKWIQWQPKSRTRVANPSSGNRKPRNQPYFATNSTKKKTQGVYHIKGLGQWLKPVSIILWEINSRAWSGNFSDGKEWHAPRAVRGTVAPSSLSTSQRKDIIFQQFNKPQKWSGMYSFSTRLRKT